MQNQRREFVDADRIRRYPAGGGENRGWNRGDALSAFRAAFGTDGDADFLQDGVFAADRQFQGTWRAQCVAIAFSGAEAARSDRCFRREPCSWAGVSRAIAWNSCDCGDAEIRAAHESDELPKIRRSRHFGWRKYWRGEAQG